MRMPCKCQGDVIKTDELAVIEFIDKNRVPDVPPRRAPRSALAQHSSSNAAAHAANGAGHGFGGDGGGAAAAAAAAGFMAGDGLDDFSFVQAAAAAAAAASAAPPAAASEPAGFGGDGGFSGGFHGACSIGFMGGDDGGFGTFAEPYPHHEQSPFAAGAPGPAAAAGPQRHWQRQQPLAQPENQHAGGFFGEDAFGGSTRSSDFGSGHDPFSITAASDSLAPAATDRPALVPLASVTGGSGGSVSGALSAKAVRGSAGGSGSGAPAPLAVPAVVPRTNDPRLLYKRRSPQDGAAAPAPAPATPAHAALPQLKTQQLKEHQRSQMQQNEHANGAAPPALPPQPHPHAHTADPQQQQRHQRDHPPQQALPPGVPPTPGSPAATLAPSHSTGPSSGAGAHHTHGTSVGALLRQRLPAHRLMPHPRWVFDRTMRNLRIHIHAETANQQQVRGAQCRPSGPAAAPGRGSRLCSALELRDPMPAESL
jgi:hypothetical protein